MFVAAGIAVRLIEMPLPAPTVTLVSSRTATLPGGPLDLAWPASGEAAVAEHDGTLIGASGPTTTVPIASLTKVMTAYVVTTDLPATAGQPEPSLTITAAEAGTLPARVAAGQSVIPVHAGLVLDQHQALQALLLASADNIADALASADAGTTTAFVAKMNAAAGRLGMAHTHYADPSGLDPASASTATDQLRLARAALAVPALATIVGQASAVIPGVGPIANYNTLVGQDGFTGIKTGSTTAAGGCLLFAVTRTVGSRPTTFTGIVLGQRHGAYIAAALAAARTLADSVFADVQARTVLPAGAAVEAVERAGQRSRVVTDAPLRLQGLPGQPVDLHVEGFPGASPRLVARTATSSGQVTLRSTPLAQPTLSWRISHLFP